MNSNNVMSRRFYQTTIFFLPFIIFFLGSCKSSEDRYVDVLLSNAGANRPELQKVINHYRHTNKDSLKLKAAFFLIENMEGMLTLDTNSVEENERYFNFLNTIDAPYWRVFSCAARGIDSMNAPLAKKPALTHATYTNELLSVSADFLIRNIDSAFYVWKNMPWAKGVSFDDFCEYILPYRCTSTYSADIRDFFLNKYRTLPDSIRKEENMFKVGKYIVNDVNSWFVEDVSFLPRYPFLKPIKFSNLLKGRIGACYDANSVRVAALRAMGVAAVFDQIPNWGNDNLPHFWFKIIDPKHDTVKCKITNNNDSTSKQYIISASTFDVPYNKGTPANIQVNYGRTVPKVYRHCFSIQKNSLAKIAGSEEIPQFFDDCRLKDVTNEYLETAVVNLQLEANSNDHRFAYLCVFDNLNWYPVTWSPINNGKVQFRDMGKNIVYLPAYFEDGEIVPAGPPFLFNSEGGIENIVFGRTTETVQLFTKFPVRSYVILWESYMLGNRFQLANKADLSDSVTVHTIDKLPFYETEVTINNSKPFRYLIYQFKRPQDCWGDGWTSEIQFFGSDQNGQEIKLNGTPIGNPGDYPDTLGKLFDGIFYNVYRPDMRRNERFAGIDLGEKNAKKITRIRYMPWTDDNAVKRNETFELFYWNDAWISLGTSRSENHNYVSFRNVPANALLLLKNTAGGVQQRIFTFRNNKQFFW